MKIPFLGLMVLAMSVPVAGAPQVFPGQVTRYSVHSATLNDDITVDVRTPQAFYPQGDVCYPVVY